MPQPHYNEEFLRRSADRTLLKRWGAPEDVAHAVRFLAQSDYITGEVIRVDGGELIALRSEN
jgi:NAD(P)-dependent dehydrogenase (short-subunit alcohol dehydrogenase family)